MDTTKIITIDDYPVGPRRDRVLDLANGAKQALFGGGCQPLSDDVLLRAAVALDRLAAHRHAWGPEVMVVSIATIFAEGDTGESEETLALLGERLCDPAAALADAVNQNRRLLGMEADQ